MRFYEINITDPKSGKPTPPQSTPLPLTSLDTSGNFNPGALNIEFDVAFVKATSPDQTSATLRIWGLGLQDIGAAFNLNGKLLTLKAGMSKGLPLADPTQQGLLLKGIILYAYGNWIQTAMTIDMLFTPSYLASPDVTGNFSFIWKSGNSMQNMLLQVLQQAMPGYKYRVIVRPELVLSYDTSGNYQSLAQFADKVLEISKQIIGGEYSGVLITTDGDTVSALDDSPMTETAPVKLIQFYDMIGQPTWKSFNLISVKLVLRGDLALGDVVTLPPALVTAMPSGLSVFRNKSIFSGNYIINNIHHYGNFREQSAESWNTTIEAYPVGTPNPSPPSTNPQQSDQ